MQVSLNLEEKLPSVWEKLPEKSLRRGIGFTLRIPTWRDKSSLENPSIEGCRFL